MTDIKSVRQKAAARKSRRIQRVKDNAALDAFGSSAKSGGTPRIPPPPVRGSGQRPPARNRGRKVPARKAAFLALKAACKRFVFARNIVLNAGLCEIAMACGGAELADTWYHGWPQKGGNGLKYEVLAHFASCSRCNMGEYGERMRGGKRYENRHKALLGLELWTALDARHGRLPISAPEAREMTARILAAIENKDWRLRGSGPLTSSKPCGSGQAAPAH